MEQVKLEVRKKKLIEVDGLKFKDLNANGKLDSYEDYRLDPVDRAKDLVSKMTLEEKAGMLMITTQNMGLSCDEKYRDQSGILNNEFKESKSNIFTDQKEYGNTRTIEELNMRHFILRENYKEDQIALWINKMNEVAEGTRLGIPVLIASNSRNENAEQTFGMNDAVGVFTTWPSTLGLAAAALGDKKNGGDYSIISEFAQCSKAEWNATGIRKGYMYMVDVVTDPRWQRIYGTFGENEELIADVARRLVKAFQGEKLNKESVALTTKHFPGGGARENGFDPHYKEGKFNVYQTEGSLGKYHLPPFKAAIDLGTSSIMPYYSIPSGEKSAYQAYMGQEVEFEDLGFAFNKYFIQDLLRKKMGFKGYVNSDSGIIDNMCWGVEDLDKVDRTAKAINNGVDIIADTNEVNLIIEAVKQGKISEERINEANIRLLIEMFSLGLFDDKTYVDVEKAKQIVANDDFLSKAHRAHQKSLVVLKNKEKVLPIKKGSKVYIEALHKDKEMAKKYTKNAYKDLKDFDNISLVENLEDADYAFVLIYPKSGNYFSATPGLLELELCEDKTNIASDGRAYKETTVSNIHRVKEISDKIHAKGGKLIVSVNTNLPWILSNVEKISDGLVASFETFVDAQMEVLTGIVRPSGLLPITLPASSKVIAVDKDGKCISPNDVPGYDKDKYMPKGMKYAYVDSEGNEYKMGFGLSY
ncbi:MAG: glycoside hydrolase family 3 N-terminal domain-containing protein [Peptoniphilaceae bacterium]|nr:glycoside hydrolase family 3 N-terminal domain-containing protein [Peptoniphilaceae bacterium]MDY6019163.1 glycoside hydrolase family 3 N-terminal domain-containing protein [Anaerococcus sp.]